MNKGFTLVELLIVIAIIGVLSATTVVNISIAKDKAQMAMGYSYEQSLIRQMSLGLTKYSNFDLPEYAPKGEFGKPRFAQDSVGIGTPLITSFADRVEGPGQCVSGACYDVTGGKFLQYNVNDIAGLFPADNSLEDVFAGGGAISLWFKPIVLPAQSILIEHGDSEEGFPHGFFVLTENKKIDFKMVFDGGTTVDWITSSSIKLNKWQHLGISYNRLDLGSSPVIVINGVQQELEVVGNSGEQLYQPELNNTRIGAGQRYGFDFDGYVDRVIISANNY